MSRVGKKPVPVPSGVEVKVDGESLSVKGTRGELSMRLHSGVKLTVENGQATVTAVSAEYAAIQGTSRARLANMIVGVTNGYAKDMEIQGVGFKVAVQGRQATFNLGYSSPIVMAIPDGIEIKSTDGVHLTVSGMDKQQVGDVAARVKSFYPAEPYKGKGIRFMGEYVRRKAGKTVA